MRRTHRRSADAKFAIVRQVDPSLVTITNDDAHAGRTWSSTARSTNPIGKTDDHERVRPDLVDDDPRRLEQLLRHWPNLAPASPPHSSLIRSNILHLSAGTSIGAVEPCVYDETACAGTNGSKTLCLDPTNPCVNVDLIVVGRPSAGAHDLLRHEHLRRPEDAPARLDAAEPARDDAGDRHQVDGRARQHLRPAAADDLSSGCRRTCPASRSTTSVRAARPAEPAGVFYVDFYYPDCTRCYYPTGCPNPQRELGAFATDAETRGREHLQLHDPRRRRDAGRRATSSLDAADTVAERDADQHHRLHRPPPAERRHPHPHERLHHRHREGARRHGRAPTAATCASARSSRRTATSRSTRPARSSTPTTTSPRPPPTRSTRERRRRGRAQHHDHRRRQHRRAVPQRRPGAISGHGGVGVPANFLEIDVDGDGGALGVLDVTDTASERTGWNIDALPPADPGAPTGTFGVFVTQTDRRHAGQPDPHERRRLARRAERLAPRRAHRRRRRQRAVRPAERRGEQHRPRRLLLGPERRARMRRHRRARPARSTLRQRLQDRLRPRRHAAPVDGDRRPGRHRGPERHLRHRDRAAR